MAIVHACVREKGQKASSSSCRGVHGPVGPQALGSKKGSGPLDFGQLGFKIIAVI